MHIGARKPFLTGLVLSLSCALVGALLVFSAPALAAAGAPTVAEESFSSVTATEATLSAQIDPAGLPTTYKVEYGTTEPYASSAEASLPAAEGAVGVLVHLVGLAPGTVYRFRFVASNELGGIPGSETTFTTGRVGGASALTLPDDRAYEPVSPLAGDQEVYVPQGPVQNPIASGASDVFSFRPSRASADGGMVTFVGEPTGTGEGTGGQGQGLGDQWLARRSSPGKGWEARDIQPNNANPETEFDAFSSDLSVGYITAARVDRLTAGVPEGCRDVYSRSSATGAYHALFTSSLARESCGGGHEPVFAGASADGSRAFFQTAAALTPGSVEAAGGESDNLYESVGGAVSPVNVLKGGEPDPNATFGGPTIPGVEPRFDFSNAISSDGSRAFWTDVSTGIVYVRENGTRTVQVSAGEGAAQYWTATNDGHYVFYTEGEKLFRFNVDRFDQSAQPEPQALTESREELAGEGPAHEKGVQGVLGASEDGSYVYFVADGVLAENENGEKEKATPQTCSAVKEFGEAERQEEKERLEKEGKSEAEIKQVLFELEQSRGREKNEEEGGRLFPGLGCNLYVLHAGATRFIATLAPRDNVLNSGNAGHLVGDWRPDLGSRVAEVTPDGRHLVFESRQRLTGYANSRTLESTRELEVFVYDAEGAGQMFCASCNPNGTPPVVLGGGSQGGEGGIDTSVPSSFAYTFMRRWTNESGTRVFFDTSQALVPQDTNGVQDVYEWEQDGEGTCRTGGGCVYLLSGGTSTDNSFLIDGSASGGDVFFATREQLVPGAGNQKMEVYDAHECTSGAPCPHETSLACTGTGCQGVPPAPPVFATPSSVTFNGIGNFPPRPPAVAKPKKGTVKCSRDKKLSHGKCVKPKHKKAKKAKRATRAGNNRRATR
jgi:hypothetical protein